MMNFSQFSVSSLIGGLVFGVFGIYLLRYGKKESNFTKMMIGLTLLVFPYFIYNAWAVWGIGTGLTIWGFRMRD
jgi:hypothetical protein